MLRARAKRSPRRPSHAVTNECTNITATSISTTSGTAAPRRPQTPASTQPHSASPQSLEGLSRQTGGPAHTCSWLLSPEPPARICSTSQHHRFATESKRSLGHAATGCRHFPHLIDKISPAPPLTNPQSPPRLNYERHRCHRESVGGRTM